MTLKNFNVFVGSSTGSLKGVVVGKNSCDTRSISRNLIRDKGELSNKNEVTCMEWSTGSSDEILVCFKNKVKLYDVTKSEFINEINPAEETICGMFKDNDSVYAALTSGVIKSAKLSDPQTEWCEYLKVNGCVERMKRSSVNTNIIATGGKDNDLKLWDMKTKEVLFAAKNIKPDELQLQVPIWVSDMLFSRQDANVATCSRHGYVRIYDPRVPQRRPVFNAHQPEGVFMCISGTPNDSQVLVGSGSGDILLVDTRAKTPFMSKYKDSCGTVKGIVCPFDSNLIFSVSLDRHFRIHDFSTRALLYKEYMQSRLTSVVAKIPFVIEKFDEKRKIDEEDTDECNSVKKVKGSKKALDKLFRNMEKV